MKGKNKKGANKKNEETKIEEAKLQKELEKYLKLTEKQLKEKENEEQITKHVKIKADEESILIKKLKEEGKGDELFNFIIQLINENIETKSKNKNLEKENDSLQKLSKNTTDEKLGLERQFHDLEIYNKSMLEKIKGMNEEKITIQTEEALRTEEVENKCEAFKKDVKQKFEVTDCETISKENQNLAEKLEEYKEGTKQIQENLEAQLNLKEKQALEFQETFNTQVQGKLDELISQSDKLTTENEELKKEVSTQQKKYEQLSQKLTKFNSKFDSSKKDYERVAQDLIKFTKENRDLKSNDIVELNKQHDEIKLELENLILANKELQEKIKLLK